VPRVGELPLERLVILLDLRMPAMSGLDSDDAMRGSWSVAELAPPPLEGKP
jgi:CheY-like chemotaxis protein